MQKEVRVVNGLCNFTRYIIFGHYSLIEQLSVHFHKLILLMYIFLLMYITARVQMDISSLLTDIL